MKMKEVIRVKLKISIALFAVGLLVFGWVQFVYIPKTDAKAEQEQLEQLEPETHQFSQVLKYEYAYMGSAGNNMNLVNNLPMSDVPRKFQQDPETFTFTVNYEAATGDVGRERLEKAIVYNATVIFALIKNMETVEFAFVDETYSATRKRVNEWFGEDVVTFVDEEVFKEKVQQPIRKNEKLAEWFAAYTEGGN